MSTLCVEIKVLTFWTIFLTKREFYFCLCRDTLSLRDTWEKKKWVWQAVELFFFFSFWLSLQGFTTEIQIKSAESFLWDGQTGNCEWGCSALCCFPRAFLSSGHHIVLLKAHPIKVRDCAHPQIPLHQGGRLRNLLEFVRIAQTQINFCNCCSATFGFLIS